MSMTRGLRDDGTVICARGSMSWWVDMAPASEPGLLVVALGQPAKAIAGGALDMCALLARRHRQVLVRRGLARLRPLGRCRQQPVGDAPRPVASRRSRNPPRLMSGERGSRRC
jgi:hypothetical protein